MTTTPNEDLIWLILILVGLFILVILIAAVSIFARTRRMPKLVPMTNPQHTCPGCDKTIPWDVKSCPFCGRPLIDTKSWWPYLWLVLFLICLSHRDLLGLHAA